MGVYGSPDTGNLYTEPKVKKLKQEGFKPQKNVWVWATIFIVNIILLLFSEISLLSVMIILLLDSLLILGISVLSLIVNLVTKRKINHDIKFIVVSLIAFLVFFIIVGICK